MAHVRYDFGLPALPQDNFLAEAFVSVLILGYSTPFFTRVRTEEASSSSSPNGQSSLTRHLRRPDELPAFFLSLFPFF